MNTNYTVGVRFTGNSSSLDAAATKAADSEAKVGRAGQEAGAQAVRGLRPISSQFDNIRGSVTRAVAGIVGGLGLVEVVRNLGRMADEYANVGAQLRLASGQTVSFKDAQAQALQVAQDTASSLRDTAELIGKLSTAFRSLGGDAQTSFTVAVNLAETINKAVALSGASGAAASAAIVQLGQGLASGVLRGDELNSVLEQTPRLAQAIAEGMGKTVGQLRTLGQEGKITAKSIVEALDSQSAKLNQEYSQLPLTIGRAWEQLKTSVLSYVGQADQAGSVSNKVANAVAAIAAHIDDVARAVVALGEVVATVYAGKMIYSGLAWISNLAAQTAAVDANGVAITGWGAKTAASFSAAKASIGILGIAFNLLGSAIAGWQIGSYLRDEFLQVRLAGIALVDGLLTSWERLKQGAVVSWLAIKAAASGAMNSIREQLANLAGAEATVFEHQLFGGGAMATKLREIEGRLRPATSAAEEFKAAVAKVNAETDKNIAAIHSTNTELADYEIAQSHAKEATSSASQSQEEQKASLKSLLSQMSDGQVAVEKNTAATRAAAAAARELAQATSEADRAQASLDERITEAHEKLSGLSDQQLEYNRGVREAVADYQSWIRAGVPVDQAMQRLSTRYQQLAELRDTNTQLAQQEINQTPQRVQAYRVETSEAERYYQVISEGAKSAADTIANYFVRNVRSIKDLWKGLADSAKTIVAQILSTWLQLRVLQPLLGSIFSGGGGGSLWGQIGSYFVQNAVGGGGSSAVGGAIGGGGSSGSSGGSSGNSLYDYYSNLKTAKSAYSYLFGAGGASSFTGGGSLVAGSTYLGPGSTALGAYGGGQSAGVLAGGTYTGPGSTAIGWSSGAPYASYTPYGGTWGVGGYSAPVASYGGALAGAWYGAHQGSGGLSTAASTVSYGALGAGIAGTAAGVAGGASVGAAAGSAFGATAASTSWIPVVGWILAAIALVDAVSGGKVFGTKYRPTQGQTYLSLGQDGGTATQLITEKRQGALFSGAKWRTKEVQASADAQKAADQLYNSISKSMVQGAQQLGVTVPAMINAQLQIQTDYNSKGQVKSTEYLVNYLGRTWKEATADAAAQRIGAEAIIATVAASAGQEAQRVAEQWRDSAQALADGAQFLLAAQTDINKGNSLLAIGASATLTQVTAFVQQMQADGETLAQTYQRLAQASAQYLQFVGQFQPQSQTFGGALEAINQQMLANINQANALAQAAGLQGAREQDLAAIHQYAAQQAAAAIAQLDSAAQDLVSKLYGVTQGSLAAITSQLDAMKAKVQASTQTAIGDLSPLNDKQKLDLALKGLRSGITSADDVLSLGRKLYASSSDYTGLYNQVMGIVGGTSGADTGASLDQYNQLAAQQATLQAQAQATQRFNDAKQLAQYVADLSQVHGVSYAEAANGLGLNLQSLAQDLGLTNLTGYLDTLKAQDIPGTTMTAASSIVDAIRGIGSDIVSAILKAPIVQPGPTTATGGGSSDAQQQALLDKLNQLIEQNNQIIKHTGATADTNKELLGNSKRDILRGTLNSSRVGAAS